MTPRTINKNPSTIRGEAQSNVRAGPAGDVVSLSHLLSIQPINREQFFSDDRWTAGVVGLGYVGLPLLLTAVRRGLGGIGFDVSQDLFDALNAGKSHIDDVSDEELEKALADGAEFTTDPTRLAEADAVFICVPARWVGTVRLTCRSSRRRRRRSNRWCGPRI